MIVELYGEIKEPNMCNHKTYKIHIDKSDYYSLVGNPEARKRLFERYYCGDFPVNYAHFGRIISNEDD